MNASNNKSVIHRKNFEANEVNSNAKNKLTIH